MIENIIKLLFFGQSVNTLIVYWYLSNYSLMRITKIRNLQLSLGEMSIYSIGYLMLYQIFPVLDIFILIQGIYQLYFVYKTAFIVFKHDYLIVFK